MKIFCALTALVLLIDVVSLAAPTFAAPSSSDDADVRALVSSARENQVAAERRIVKRGIESVPALLKGLDDPNVKLRRRCLRLVEVIRPSSPGYIALLTRRAHAEPDPSIRRQYLGVLRLTHTDQAIREIEQFAEKDPDSSVRLVAISQITLLAARKEEKFLRRRLKAEPDLEVRLRIYRALATLGDKSGRNLAKRVLNRSTGYNERIDAVKVIGAIGDPNDIPYLKSFEENPKADIHFYARDARRHIELLQMPESQRLPYLINALWNPAQNVRDWATDELAQRAPSDPATIKALKHIAARPECPGWQDARIILSEWN